MLSRNRIRLIRSLADKKCRDESGLFVAEGPRLVGDMLTAFRCVYMAVSEGGGFTVPAGVAESDTVSPGELARASLLATPHEVVAVFEKPSFRGAPDVSRLAREGLCLALDGVQDPGNVGTIIRTACWFGISAVVCSRGTADVYSPKALQATMGALANVMVYCCDLPQALAGLPVGTPVYGTFLEGESIYSAPLTESGVIVIGNEGSGISPAVEKAVTRRLYIPPYPRGKRAAESLNAAAAAAVVCAEFRRGH